MRLSSTMSSRSLSFRPRMALQGRRLTGTGSRHWGSNPYRGAGRQIGGRVALHPRIEIESASIFGKGGIFRMGVSAHGLKV